MDLYIQIGVLLLFLAAFSLFVYFYTQPAQLFSDGIQETSAQISQQVADIKDKDLIELHANTNASGSSIINLINKAEAKKIAILVQTRNQNELTVNYGYQLRPANSTTNVMNPHGKMNSQAVEFELNNVTHTAEMFFKNAGVVNNAGILAGATLTSGNAKTSNSNLYGSSVNGSLYPITSEMRRTLENPGSLSNIPKLSTSSPIKTISDSKKSGENFNNSGYLYTDNLLQANSVNKNRSHMSNKSSRYYINKNAKFYTTIILDSNKEVVGIYAEEHDVNASTNILRILMQNSGLSN